MKKYLAIALLASLFLAVGACSNPDMFGSDVPNNNTAKQYLDNNPQTPPDVANAILHHKIMKGMTIAQVLASWGKPCMTCPGTNIIVHGPTTLEYDWFDGGPKASGAGTVLYFDPDGTLMGWGQ